MLSLPFFGYYSAHARSRAFKCDAEGKWRTSTLGVIVLGDGVPSENQLTCRLFLYRLRCAVFHAVCCEKTAERSSFTYLTIPSND
jgi:hypothetical protein